MIRLTRCYAFPAAHVLCSPELSDEENRRVFGKCANPAGHGHDYRIEVTVEGELDSATGELVPVAELDRLFEDAVRAPLGHRMLNETERFRGLVPTAENVARVVHEDLDRELARRGAPRLAGVRVVETSRNSFETGEAR